MGLLNRDGLLKKEKLEVVKVDLGNDDFVFVKQMTGGKRDKWEQSLMKPVKDDKGIVTGFESVTENFRAKLCVVTVCDAEGILLLAPKDFITLSNSMSAAKLEKIVNAATKLNAISEEDKEEILKNSDAGQAGNSPSDFAENLK